MTRDYSPFDYIFLLYFFYYIFFSETLEVTPTKIGVDACHVFIFA